jgi:hypothetical protein
MHKSAAYKEGYKAGNGDYWVNARVNTDNPYSFDDNENWKDWSSGWHAGWESGSKEEALWYEFRHA